MKYVYVLFACICLCDYLWHRIPNGILAVIFLLGEWEMYGNAGVDGLLAFNGVALFTGCAFYLFFQLGALGAGDVKLLAATAGFFRPGMVPVYLFVGLCVAACVGAAKMFWRGKMRERVGVLAVYLQEMILTKSARLYPTKLGEAGTGVCLAGPMFLSFVLVGGLM